MHNPIALPITAEQALQLVTFPYPIGGDSIIASEIACDYGFDDLLITDAGIICLKSGEANAIDFMNRLATHLIDD